MAKESLEKTIEERERFMEASKEVWPLILKIREIMDKYKLPDSVSITVGADGYSEFSPRGMAWELHTSFQCSPPFLPHVLRSELIPGDCRVPPALHLLQLQ